MEIKEILEERPWEEFLVCQPHTSFLQSWAWGEFQEKLGFSHRRFGIYQGGALVGICQALVGRRKLGQFIYVPRGPVLKSFERSPAQAILEYLRDFSARQKVDYLRVEPPWESNQDFDQLLGENEGRRAEATAQAGGATLLLDLALSEEEFLDQMRKTTRYLLQNTAGLGIEIHKSADPRKMEEFYRLTNVARRWQGFVPHPRRYLQMEFETLAPRGMAELFWAKYRNDVLSAAIVFSYGDTVTYVHSASTRSEVPASYHLLWEIIKEAKKDGYRYFDFWGINSLLKKGFGGYQVNYAGAWDYPLSPKYWTVFGIEKLRRLIRRN